MARTQLFTFRHDNKEVKVYTGESSADVYYSVAGGSSKSAGIRWNADRGDFKSGSGQLLSNAEAQARVRALL